MFLCDVNSNQYCGNSINLIFFQFNLKLLTSYQTSSNQQLIFSYETSPSTLCICHLLDVLKLKKKRWWCYHISTVTVGMFLHFLGCCQHLRRMRSERWFSTGRTRVLWSPMLGTVHQTCLSCAACTWSAINPFLYIMHTFLEDPL